MSELLADKTYKVIIIGNAHVGKTCILRRFTHNEFTTSTASTIGVAFGCKTINIENSVINLNILDTAGQEMYKSITPTYYRQAIGAFIVFDVTDRSTFTNISHWLDELNANCDSNKIIKLLIGNKVDLPRTVTYEEAFNFANSQRMPYIETSASSNQNITLAFENLAKIIHESRRSFIHNNDEISPISGNTKKIKDSFRGNKKKNSCCCGRDDSI